MNYEDEKKYAQIKEAAMTGLDLSPGDPIAIMAVEVIESLLETMSMRAWE